MPTRDPTTDTQRYDALKRTVAEVGLLRRGSLVQRFMPCGKPNCRCQATPPQLHGPYYQWTRKVRGKTVTVRLTEQQAERVRDWTRERPTARPNRCGNGDVVAADD